MATTTTLLGLTLTLSPHALTALRLAPLLSTTASLTHAYMEYITTTAFLRPAATHPSAAFAFAKEHHTGPPANAAAVAQAKDTLVPVWFTNFFATGVWSVIGINSVSLLSAAANLWLLPGGLGAARTWYVAGFVGALAHYAFVPGVMGSVEGLFGLCVRGAKGEKDVEEEKGRAEGLVREWVGVHRIRMSTVDLVAWGSFFVGVVGVLTV